MHGLISRAHTLPVSAEGQQVSGRLPTPDTWPRSSVEVAIGSAVAISWFVPETPVILSFVVGPSARSRGVSGVGQDTAIP
jgi:hypothetical protein